MKLELVLQLLSSLASVLKFTYEGLVDWMAETKQKAGKLRFYGGVAVIVIVIISLIADAVIHNIKINKTDIDKPPIERKDEENEEHKEDEESGYYVRNKLYNDAVYTGYIDSETQKPNGVGAMNYYNKSFYDGEWAQGKREGQGVMTYYNGDVYDGGWKDDMRDGFGKYSWSDGKTYEGDYVNDKREGEGTFTGWTGYVETYGWAGKYVGGNKNDMFEGYGTFTFDNGDKFDGIFSANRIWVGVYTNSDGSTFNIVNGEAVGS